MDAIVKKALNMTNYSFIESGKFPLEMYFYLVESRLPVDNNQRKPSILNE